MTKRLALLCGSAVLCASVFGCSSPADFELSAGVFASELLGDAGLDDSLPSSFGDVSLNSDLDLDDREMSPYVRGGLSAGGFNLRANALQTEHSSQGTLSAAFGDITVGSTVESDFDLTLAQLSLSYDLIDAGPVRIAPGIAADYFDLQLDVVETATSLTERLDVQAPVPMLYVEAEIDPPAIPLRLVAEIGGMKADHDDFDGLLLDGQALLFLELPGPLEVFAGYRTVRVDVEGTTDGQRFDSNLRLEGFLAGGTLRF